MTQDNTASALCSCSWL